MHGNAPQSFATGVPGWETEPEQRLLLDLAAQVPENGLIVEIGGEFGMSASLFCYAAPASAEIITIDLFPGDLLEKHRANLAEAGFEGRSTQVATDSRSYKLAKKTKIDLLFVDGDHTYAGVKADIERFTPHITVGGHAAFHDSLPPGSPAPPEDHPNYAVARAHYEVMLAIDEWFDPTRWEALPQVGTIRAFKRLK